MVAELMTTGRDVVWFLAEHLDAYDFFMETQSIGLATGIIYTPGEAMADPHFVARGFPAEIEHPELGRTFTYPGAPYRFTATPWHATPRPAARRAPIRPRLTVLPHPSVEGHRSVGGPEDRPPTLGCLGSARG